MELDEDSKPLTDFMVGPLVFLMHAVWTYECARYIQGSNGKLS